MHNILRRAFLATTVVLALSACSPAQAEAWLALSSKPAATETASFADSATTWWADTLKPVPEAAPASSLAPPPWVIWDDLAVCESTYQWHINSGNGFYGGLQFVPSTWRAYGGAQFASSAHLASREQQINVAIKVQRSQGWGAWPGCARKLGLR